MPSLKNNLRQHQENVNPLDHSSLYCNKGKQCYPSRPCTPLPHPTNQGQLTLSHAGKANSTYLFIYCVPFCV